MLQYSWDPLILPADDQAWANPGKGIVRVTVAALTLIILYAGIGCWVEGAVIHTRRIDLTENHADRILCWILAREKINLLNMDVGEVNPSDFRPDAKSEVLDRSIAYGNPMRVRHRAASGITDHNS